MRAIWPQCWQAAFELFSSITGPAAGKSLSRYNFIALQRTPTAAEEVTVINSSERAEQDISRVKSCPPVTGSAARACEDNLKGKWGQEGIFLPEVTEELWKNWGEISAGLERN